MRVKKSWDMRKLNLKILYLVGGVLAAALLAAMDILDFKDSVAGTIGPGVYPMVTLGLMFITGAIIIIRAFVPVNYSLLSPFGGGSLRGLAVSRLAQVLTRELGDKVLVRPGIGQGFFSSFFAAGRAKPDGHTLVVLSSSGPTPSPFSNAAECLQRFIPVMRLSENPLLLVAPSGWRDGGSGDLAGLVVSGQLGLSAHPETASFLVKALSQRIGAKITTRIFDSTFRLLHALAKGEVAAALCPLDELEASKLPQGCIVAAVGSQERLNEYPVVPTMTELGLELTCGDWSVLALPRGVDRGLAKQLWQALARPENREEISRGMLEHGIRPALLGPEETEAVWQKQAAVAGEIGRDTGFWREEGQMTSLYKVLAGLALFAGFMALAPFTGYLAASLVFVLGLCMILWPGSLKTALPLITLVSLGSALAVYFVFTEAFMVVFP